MNGVVASGILLNNENNDKKPYVLTARHILTANNFDVSLSAAEKASAQNATFTFKLRRITCGGTVNETTEVYTGAIFRAADFFTDFALLEIHPNNLPLDPDLVYAGWKRESPSGNFSHIAHPNGDPQKISFGHKATIQSYDPWKTTVNWDQGGTSSGASGGALFNDAKQVIGALSYAENFGRFDKMWDRSSSTDKQLKYWLSPYSNLSSMDYLKPFSFNGIRPEILCYGTNRTVNMPHLAPGQNVTWTTSSNVSIVNSGGNFANITANGPSASGWGWVRATWEGQAITLDLTVGKPALNLLTYDFSNTPVSALTVVTPYDNHYMTLYPVRNTSYSWNQSWSSGVPSGSPGVNRFDFQLQPGQSLFFSPLSVTNECGTSTRTIEFWANWSSILVYPNPASNVLTVEFSRTDQKELMPDAIYLFSDKSSTPALTMDVASEGARKNIVNNKVEIDVSKFERGTYFVHLVKGKKVEKRRVNIK
ncbi:hypothetical protein ASG33_10845 [Dyadobacter sp. Leaf189]|nr:hypothetical protein ASG33_10845 [Dyadobacter sp. Leaf189]